MNRFKQLCHTVLAVSLIACLWGCAATGPAGPDLPSSESWQLATIPDGVSSRAITWENRTGAPGQGGQAVQPDLGKGRKGSPCIRGIEDGETVTLMDVEGPGIIRHIWMTYSPRNIHAHRNMILRMYWDGSDVPSVEVPLADFFGQAHGRPQNFASAYMTSPRGRGYNCYFPMPFGSHARITVTNDMGDGRKLGALFFQIDYELRDHLPSQLGRFHAQFRRQNPTVLKQDYVVLDGVEGPGKFVGCVIGVRALGPRWWGEGEMKFYIDGDTDYPTICGTGTEDYFCAAYGMYTYQTPYHGCTLEHTDDFFNYPLVSMYRWHGPDPVYFKENFKATIQQIGYRSGLFERSDDWCSTAYWYQRKPMTQMPPLPDRSARIANLIPPKKSKG
jgi:hypothetical protein